MVESKNSVVGPILEKLKQEADNAQRQGLFEQSVKLYEHCLQQIDPIHKSFSSILFFNRASALQKMSKNEEALTDLEQALKLNPNYEKAKIKRGDILAQ